MKRFTLGSSLVLIAVVSLIMALIVQSWRAAERESLYQLEIARLRAELAAERDQLVKPNFANMSDR
jgi:hypothetical protein